MAAFHAACAIELDHEGLALRPLQPPAVQQQPAVDLDECVSSDGDEPWQPTEPAVAAAGVERAGDGGALRQRNALLPPPNSQYDHNCVQQQRSAFRRSAAQPAAMKLAGGSGSASRAGFRRPMKTSAAALADQAAAERSAAEEAELAAALADTSTENAVARTAEEEPPQARLPGPEVQAADAVAPQQGHAAAAAARPAGGSSFLNRRALPRASSQAQESGAQAERGSPPAPAAAHQPGERPAARAGLGRRQAGGSTVPAVEARQEQQQQQQQTVPRPSAAQQPGGAQAGGVGPSQPASTRAAAAFKPAAVAAGAGRPSSAPAPPAATYHRTDDGLNVVYMRQPTAVAGGEDPGGRGSKGKSGSVNSGWGNNFVKMDLKKGKGSTKYGTKYGSKKRKKGGRFSSRWQTSRLRQVGDGSDFLEGWAGSKLRCFKCGGAGHFAKDCTAEQQAQADMGALLDSSDDGDSGGEGKRTRAIAAAAPQQQQQQQQQGGTASAAAPGPDGSHLRMASSGSLATAAAPVGDPAEQYADVLADPTEEALTGVLRSVFGHPAFRGLQLDTVRRLLGGESLLSIMPTGMGKSLCYQLPAALLPGLTLVVSPLIALMHDQAASVPPPLTAAVLWSGQSRAAAVQVLSDVAAGLIKVLFVSPERLNNPHLLEALRPCMPLPLVVVDEAHCVAEWGHSFRPAYFRLGAALAGGVHAQRILALTATATRATEAAILQVLRIPAGSVLRDSAVRPNLRLQVLRTTGGGSSQSTRERICAMFAAHGPLGGVRAGIVYCAFKEDANQLARLLGVRGVTARAYHAGKDYRERAAVEADFAAGRVRVVVATVAFGMGINLAGVGAVVHATMPRSLEEYVQQVGRAGRDGSEARCVALLDDGDFVRLRCLASSGVVDLPAVRGFLEAVFSPAAEGERVRRCTARAAKGRGKATPAGGGKGRKRKAAAEAQTSEPEPAAGAEQQQDQEQQQDAQADEAAAAAAAGEEPCDGDGTAVEAEEAPSQRRRFGVLAVRKLAAEVDMREESMEAVLSYLEAGQGPCLRMLPTAAMSVKVSFYAAPPEELGQRHPVLQHVVESCAFHRNGVYSAPAAKLAAAAQKAPGLVVQDLRDLAAGGLIGFELSREEGPAYEILNTPPDLAAVACQIHARLGATLACQVSRLDTSYRALAAALAAGQASGPYAGQVGDGQDGPAAAQEAALRAAVERYFDEDTAGPTTAGSAAAPDGSSPDAAAPAKEAAGSGASAAAPAASSVPLPDTTGLPLKPATPALLTATRAVLRSNREQAGPELSARALARILHGVGSPAFPPDAWRKRMGAFWGSQVHVDFAAVLRAAEIVMRGEGPPAGAGSATDSE